MFSFSLRTATERTNRTTTHVCECVVYLRYFGSSFVRTEFLVSVARRHGRIHPQRSHTRSSGRAIAVNDEWACEEKKEHAVAPDFFVMDETTGVIAGAFRMSRCTQVQGSAVLSWNCDLVVPLLQAVQLEDGGFEQRGKFLELSVAVVGGTIHDHFLEQAGSRWWVWPADTVTIGALARAQGRPCTIATPVAYCQTIGVQPELVRSVLHLSCDSKLPNLK